MASKAPRCGWLTSVMSRMITELPTQDVLFMDRKTKKQLTVKWCPARLLHCSRICVDWLGGVRVASALFPQRSWLIVNYLLYLTPPC